MFMLPTQLVQYELVQYGCVGKRWYTKNLEGLYDMFIINEAFHIFGQTHMYIILIAAPQLINPVRGFIFRGYSVIGVP